MVVVAIIGLIMAAGAPTLYKMLHKEGFRKTMSDIVDVCQSARSQAILSGKTTEVIFHPQAGTCSVSGGGKDSGGWGNWSTSASWSDTARLDGLFVNLAEYTSADEARVRFFKDGTCDEMILILTSDRGVQTGVTLEITTALPTVLSTADLQRLRR